MAEQKSLDRPELREKLTEAFCINSGDILPQCNECIHFNSVSEHRCDNPKIDEILALIPDIEEQIDANAQLEYWHELYKGRVEEAKKQIAYALFEEIICPMCYRLNPQHATMDNGKGCHYCHDREYWQALKEEK